MNHLFFVTYPGDLRASRSDMVRNGFPEDCLISRDLRSRLRKAANSDNDGWSLSGPGWNLSLKYQKTVVCYVECSKDGETFYMKPDQDGLKKYPKIEIPLLETWLREGSEFWRDELCCGDIRRAAEMRFKRLGAVDTRLPSLFEVDSTLMPIIRETVDIIRATGESESGGELDYQEWEVA